jgi:hypothetical protein
VNNNPQSHLEKYKVVIRHYIKRFACHPFPEVGMDKNAYFLKKKMFKDSWKEGKN